MDTIIKELIDETPVIFKDESTLAPLYVPTKIVERDELIIALVRNLRKLVRHQLPYHMLILGGNGTGKTVTMRYVMEQIGEATSDFYYIHLYGSDEAPLYETLREIAQQCNCMLPAKDLSWGAVFAEFAESLEIQKKPLVIVLDEFDYFITGNMFKLLKKLSRTQNVCIIAISNDYNVLDVVDDLAFLSVFIPQHVEFTEYTHHELEEIIYERAKEALLPNTYEVEVVPLIAMLTIKNRSGDARYALDLLKYSVNHCVDDNRDRILESDVRAVVERVELIYNAGAVTRLTPQLQRIVKQIIKQDGDVKRKDVFDAYNRSAKHDKTDPISRTKFSYYLTTLERKGVIERINKGAGRGKGIERLVRISLNLDVIELREALAEYA